MKDNKLELYEALELRREYRRKINYFKSVMPENLTTNRWGESNNKRPIDDDQIWELEDEIKSYKNKLRLLNEEIQKVNREHSIRINGEDFSLASALEYRKELKSEIEELAEMLPNTAYYDVKFNSQGENDKIMPLRDYDEVKNKLEENMSEFRDINTKLRKAQHEITVNFRDE